MGIGGSAVDGGAFGANSASSAAGSATANRGGGGGGSRSGFNGQLVASPGGSGIVIVRYAI
jgi:hypothetical protein